MFTEEELRFIYRVIKDTVSINTTDQKVQLQLLIDQDAAYALMKNVFDPLCEQPTEQPAND